MDNITTKQNRIKKDIAVVCIILLGAMVFVMSFLSINSADDYWYSEFMNFGLRNYLVMMKQHYLTFNGRMIVHFFAQLILHFPKIGFGVFSTLFAFLTPLLASVLFELDEDKRILSILFFEAFVLLLPRSIMTNAYLWVSAFCNYALPVLFIITALVLIKGVLKSEKTPLLSAIFAIIMSFVSGASTEQNGLCMMLICIIIYLYCIIKTKEHIIFSMLCTLSAIIGVTTIFISPATFGRLTLETSGQTVNLGFIDAIWHSISVQSAFFAEFYFLMVLVIGLLCIISIRLYAKHNDKAILVVGILLPVILLFGILLDVNVLREVSYLLLLSEIMILPLVYFVSEGQYLLALLPISAAGSLFIMVFTQSNGSRSFLPFSVYLFVLCATQLSVLLDTLRCIYSYLTMAVLVIVSGISFGCALPHYLYNYRLDADNDVRIEQGVENGVVEVSVDYDLDYTYHKFYNNADFYNRYLECKGINADYVDFYMVSDTLPEIYFNTTKAHDPAFVDAQGEYQLQLSETIEALGGSSKYNYEKGRAEIKLKGRTYYYNYTKKEFQWRDENGKNRTYPSEYLSNHYRLCFGINTFADVFDLKISMNYDGDKLIRINVQR